jgi:hypothetical protein
MGIISTCFLSETLMLFSQNSLRIFYYVNTLHLYMFVWTHKCRVIRYFLPELQDVIPSQKFNLNICPILNGYVFTITSMLKSKNKRTSTYIKFLVLNVR